MRRGKTGSAGAPEASGASRASGKAEFLKYLYIGGKWTEAADGGTAQTINPYDATPLDTLAEACAADVDAAVAAAREAFDGPWRRSTVTDRAGLLAKIADLLQRDREQLAHTESLDTGKTLNEARADVDDTTAVFRYYAGSRAPTRDGWSTPGGWVW